MSSSRSRISSRDHITPSCHASVGSSCLWVSHTTSVLKNLVFLRSTGLVYHRLPIFWDLFGLFLVIRLAFGLREEDHIGKAPFSPHHLRCRHSQHESWPWSPGWGMLSGVSTIVTLPSPPRHDGFQTCRDEWINLCHSMESVGDTLAREQEIPKAFWQRLFELSCLDQFPLPLDNIFASLSLAFPG